MHYFSIDEGGSVASDIYVNGQKIEAKAGTYENAIVVPADADCVVAVDMVADINVATTPGIVPADRTELVANTDMGMGALPEKLPKGSVIFI